MAGKAELFGRSILREQQMSPRKTSKTRPIVHATISALFQIKDNKEKPLAQRRENMTQACRPLLSHSGCPMNDRLLTDRLWQWFSLFMVNLTSSRVV